MALVGIHLVQRLVSTPMNKAILAAQRQNYFEPLFAKYLRTAVLPVAENQLLAHKYSLQSLLRIVGVEDFPLSPSECDQLTDWDCPEDIIQT
jgi:molybdopterin-guanine dinucleotide biosynthesis protein A